jgi:hypothetical protein
MYAGRVSLSYRGTEWIESPNLDDDNDDTVIITFLGSNSNRF